MGWKKVENGMLRILCLGDIVGRPGRAALAQLLPGLRAERRIDLVIANAENASGGTGIVPDTIRELQAALVDIVTLGDHVWQRQEIAPLLDSAGCMCIRPANYPEGAPGRGCLTYTTKNGILVGVFNLLGRVFINGALDCPFRTVERILAGPLSNCRVIIGDIHAEASSEKWALAHYLDGKVSLLFGTHTHVQTADEQILPGGTGYITDVGMCGCVSGVLGMDTQVAVKRFVMGIPQAYKLAKGPVGICGVLVTVAGATGKAAAIERIALRVGG